MIPGMMPGNDSRQSMMRRLRAVVRATTRCIAKSPHARSPVSSWHFAGTQPPRHSTADLAWQIRARSCITLSLRRPLSGRRQPRRIRYRIPVLGLPGPRHRKGPARWEGNVSRWSVPPIYRFHAFVVRSGGRRNAAMRASVRLAVDGFSLGCFCDKPAAEPAVRDQWPARLAIAVGRSISIDRSMLGGIT